MGVKNALNKKKTAFTHFASAVNEQSASTMDTQVSCFELREFVKMLL